MNQILRAAARRISASAASLRVVPQRVRRRAGHLRSRRRFAPQLQAVSEARLVRLQGAWRVCHLNRDRSTIDLQDENLAMAVEALDDADVEYVALPSAAPDRHRIGVPIELKLRALQALAQHWGSSPVYLRTRRHTAFAAEATSSPFAIADVVRVYAYYISPGSTFVADHRFGCDIEFYRTDGADLTFLPGNRVTERLPRDLAIRASTLVAGRELPTFAPLWDRRFAYQIDFPVDVVYTWVDGDDPEWSAKRAEHLATLPDASEEAAGAPRYLNRDELRFSLRSLHQFAGWVNHIYLVTDGQTPQWLVRDHPRLTVLHHRDIFDDPEKLPTFNSHAIESQLHHIPGLSEHYLYLNDDVYFGRRVSPGRFFHANGLAKMFLSHHQLDIGPTRPDDPPLMSSAKNGRRLIEEHFGRTVTQKICHAPHPQRRSVLYEMEERFDLEFDRVSRSRFRSPTDISPASSLHHHYGFQVGTSVPDRLRYSYMDSLDPRLASHLRRLDRRRSYEVFCVNDTAGDREELERVSPLIRRFLESYYPVPSPFEEATKPADGDPALHVSEAS